MKEYYEGELVKALTRQAFVHRDSMELNNELLQKDFERRIKQNADIVEAEQLVELRMKYKQATSTLAAMEKALKGNHFNIFSLNWQKTRNTQWQVFAIALGYLMFLVLGNLIRVYVS